MAIINKGKHSKMLGDSSGAASREASRSQSALNRAIAMARSYSPEDEDTPTETEKVKSKLFKLKDVLAYAQSADLEDPEVTNNIYSMIQEAGYGDYVPQQKMGTVNIAGGAVQAPTGNTLGQEEALKVIERLKSRFLMEKQAGGPKTVSGVDEEGYPIETDVQAGVGQVGPARRQFQKTEAHKHGDVITQPGPQGQMPTELGTIETEEGKAKAAAAAKKASKEVKNLTVSQAKAVMDSIEKQNNLANMMVDPETGQHDPMFPQHPLTDQLPALQEIIKTDVSKGVKERGLTVGGEKVVKRTGKVKSGPNAGKTVVEYTDGTREYK